MEAKPFKILCIDGGGIKGIYSAELLAKFEDVFGCVVSDGGVKYSNFAKIFARALAASLKFL